MPRGLWRYRIAYGAVAVLLLLSARGSSAQGFFLENRLQACSGGAPAVLLWWSVPAGAGNNFTVRSTDGAYTETVNSSQDGRVHLVSSLLVPGQIYSFYVEGTLNGSPIQTNIVKVPVLSDECRLAVGAGELPHLPVAWTGLPYCSGGTALLPVQWTAVGGATSYTLTRIDYVTNELQVYPNLTSTSFADTGLVPGAVYEYILEAIGSGGNRLASRFSAFIPSGVCGEPTTPGSFEATVSEPVCAAGKGAVTLGWTSSSGATSPMETFRSDDGFAFGRGSTFSGSSYVIDGIRPGALLKLMVQAESATTPNQYRSRILAQRVPLDICGGAGTQAPSVTTVAATYIQDQLALLRASISPNGAPTDTYIEWGTNTYDKATPLRDAGDGYRRVSLGETLTGLACNTTYQFRGVAVNSMGKTVGTSSSFTTLPCPAVCYPLSRSVNDPSGGGSPVVTPEQSPGCPSGQYTAGQAIQVTASPAAGWQVGNWAGTQTNNSTSTNNTVTMPARNHFVHVNYVRPLDSTSPLSFYTLAPCRLLNTRQTASPLRSVAGPLRTVPVTGVCGVPSSARAVSINITAVDPTSAGFITLFPADQLQPGTSSINFRAGQTRANNAVLALSASGLLGAVAGIAANSQVDLLIDVNGYFVPDP